MCFIFEIDWTAKVTIIIKMRMRFSYIILSSIYHVKAKLKILGIMIENEVFFFVYLLVNNIIYYDDLDKDTNPAR